MKVKFRAIVECMMDYEAEVPEGVEPSRAARDHMKEHYPEIWEHLYANGSTIYTVDEKGDNKEVIW